MIMVEPENAGATAQRSRKPARKGKGKKDADAMEDADECARIEKIRHAAPDFAVYCSLSVSNIAPSMPTISSIGIIVPSIIITIRLYSSIFFAAPVTVT